MATAFKIPTTVVNAGTFIDSRLDGQITVGQLAHHLSATEPDIDSSTLEMAFPASASSRLHFLNWQAGDRLLVLTNPLRQGELPVSVAEGDRVLRFSASGMSLSSAGKRTLLMGKPDTVGGETPDIDLRLLLPPNALDFVSRSCVRLTYDPVQGMWYAARTGKTRIMLDDLELTDQRMPFNTTQDMVFYRASDQPGTPGSKPLGVVHVDVEAAAVVPGNDGVRSGTHRVPLTLGSESDSVLVRASESIQVDQIVTRLMDFHGIRLGATQPDVRIMRLVPPSTPLQSLSFENGAYLYATNSQIQETSVLQLVDVHDRQRTYEVLADREDRALRLGWRANGQPADYRMDLDLRESVVSQQMLPFDVVVLVRYQASEGQWWVDPAGQSGAAVFVNSTRLSGAPLALTSGDVLSFGMSVSHYFARLEVDITSRRE